MQRNYTNNTASSSTAKNIPFLSTLEMEQLNSPPPRSTTLRGKLNSMHSKIARRYDKPTKPSKERRVSLTHQYSQRHRRPVQSMQSTDGTGKSTLTTEADGNTSPEARARAQLHNQRKKGPQTRCDGLCLTKSFQNTRIFQNLGCQAWVKLVRSLLYPPACPKVVK